MTGGVPARSRSAPGSGAARRPAQPRRSARRCRASRCPAAPRPGGAPARRARSGHQTPPRRPPRCPPPGRATQPACPAPPGRPRRPERGSPGAPHRPGVRAGHDGQVTPESVCRPFPQSRPPGSRRVTCTRHDTCMQTAPPRPCSLHMCYTEPLMASRRQPRRRLPPAAGTAPVTSSRPPRRSAPRPPGCARRAW